MKHGRDIFFESFETAKCERYLLQMEQFIPQGTISASVKWLVFLIIAYLNEGFTNVGSYEQHLVERLH